MAAVDVRGRLLELDPDLGERLDERRRAAAGHELVVRLASLDVGPWTPEQDAYGAADGIGLLVVDGFMLRHVALEHRAAAEVLGPGDILRPGQDDGEVAVYPYPPGGRVVRAMRLAVLDLAATARLGRHPEVVAALVGRAMSRSRRIAGHLVLAQFGSVEHRVLLALWHMSDLWGRVGPRGIVLPVPLTHAMLGSLVGARRPSVTAALGALAEKGLVCPEEGGGFRLTGRPPADLPLLRGHAPGRRATITGPPGVT